MVSYYQAHSPLNKKTSALWLLLCDDLMDDNPDAHSSVFDSVAGLKIISKALTNSAKMIG